jgi:dolichol-phosphate mannosyltransferase
MAQVSLIVPTEPRAAIEPEQVSQIRAALEAAGYAVELIVAGVPGRGGDGWRQVGATVPGRASAAMAGLAEAHGEILVVVDPRMGYPPDDVVRLVEALAEGRAEMAIASRFARGLGRLRAIPGSLLRRGFGTSDPLTGLIGLTRTAYRAAAPTFSAVGSRFAFELLAKVRGRWEDVPARPKAPLRWALPGWDDIRHWKRLADHRFGNLSRLVQFCMVGASGMVVDLTCYALFQWVFAHTGLAARSLPVIGPLDLAAAAVVAVGLALTWNFTINRRLTFSDARHGTTLRRQYATYVASNALAILVNLTLRLRLPQYVPFFRRHKLMAAVVGIVVATGISFSMARWVVFRRPRVRAHVAPDVDPAEPAEPPPGAHAERPSRRSWPPATAVR